MDDLARDPRSLHLYVRRLLSHDTEEGDNKNDQNLILVVDQFEELFTLCRDQTERQYFIDNLLNAAGVSPVWSQNRPENNQAELMPSPNPLPSVQCATIVIITLRADFYAHCAQYDQLRQALAQHQEYIGPMNADELRRAIEGPAQQGRWTFEPGLVDLLLQDVGDEPGALPLLSHALLETWQRRRGRVLTFGGYSESGRVQGAIAQTAEWVLQRLELEQQSLARNIFLRLTELGEGTLDTRRRVRPSELIPRPDDKLVVETVLKTLADARLIITSEDAVEVAHEALIREWPTLQSWLDENREALQLHRHLTEAAKAWEKLNRDPGELYRGARLVQASEWAETYVDDLNVVEREFLEASQDLARRQEAEREARRQRELESAKKLAETKSQAAQRLRWLTAGLAAFLAVAVGTAWLAVNLRNEAQANFTTAERIRLAAQAQIALDNGEGGDLPALLALHSLKHGYSLEADAALLNALNRGFARQQYLGHQSAVRDVHYSQDGLYVLTAATDGTVRLWEAQTGLEVRQFIGHSFANAAIFSPDGDFMLTGSDDDTVRLWDTESGEEIHQFVGHTDRVAHVVFSPDGSLALIGSADQTARLWDIETGQIIRQFTDHASSLLFVGFSNDGRFVLTGDIEAAYRWRSTLDEVTKFTCAQLSRDLTPEERALYNITDKAPICPNFSKKSITPEPTWTPVPPSQTPITSLGLAPMEQPGKVVLEMEFLNDMGMIQMEIPMQDVYLDAGNGQVMRPTVVNAETLSQPLYRSAVEVELDLMEPPFDTGPYPKGEPLGFTLADWVAAKGHGTYTAKGDRAVLDLTFDKLVPNGVYTIWCVIWNFEEVISEVPCGAPDGSENGFITDANGQGEITIEVDAFPPSTEEAINGLVAAYHSEGKNWGDWVGPHGLEAHIQLFFDFMPGETPILPPLPQPISEVVEMEFLNDMASVQMEMPMQDVYLDAGNGQVMRPTVVNADTLAQPLYRSSEEVELDLFEPPFDTGPYPKGEPLGFTLADWVAATGQGTYTVKGDRAVIDLTFDKLVPNGVYTVWCLVWNFEEVVSEVPCGALDGSENTFVTDANGHGEITIEVDAFAPSTEEAINEIAIAYHSEGKTWGEWVGPHGLEAHVQMWYDFMPPSDE